MVEIAWIIAGVALLAALGLALSVKPKQEDEECEEPLISQTPISEETVRLRKQGSRMEPIYVDDGDDDATPPLVGVDIVDEVISDLQDAE